MKPAVLIFFTLAFGGALAAQESTIPQDITVPEAQTQLDTGVITVTEFDNSEEPLPPEEGTDQVPPALVEVSPPLEVASEPVPAVQEEIPTPEGTLELKTRVKLLQTSQGDWVPEKDYPRTELGYRIHIPVLPGNRSGFFHEGLTEVRQTPFKDDAKAYLGVSRWTSVFKAGWAGFWEGGKDTGVSFHLGPSLEMEYRFDGPNTLVPMGEEPKNYWTRIYPGVYGELKGNLRLEDLRFQSEVQIHWQRDDESPWRDKVSDLLMSQWEGKIHWLGSLGGAFKADFGTSFQGQWDAGLLKKSTTGEAEVFAGIVWNKSFYLTAIPLCISLPGTDLGWKVDGRTKLDQGELNFSLEQAYNGSYYLFELEYEAALE